MIPTKNYSYKKDFYDNLFANKSYRDTEYYHIRNPKHSIIQELQREDLSEKVFYEKVKIWFEKSNEVNRIFYIEGDN